MKKTLIALMALSTSALAFDDTVWNFEDKLSSETGAGLHTAGECTYGKYVTTPTGETDGEGNPITSTSWVAAAADAVTYVESGLTEGTKVGDYYLNRDLGKAVTLSDGSFIKVGDAYWSNGAGKIGCGTGFTNSYTLMAWAKFDSISGAQALFGTADGANSGMAFSLIHGNEMNLCAKNVADHCSSTLTLSPDTWYNLAVSYDSTTNEVSYYLNGELMGTNTMSNSYNGAGGSGAAIGSGAKDTAKDVMRGAIAEFKILDGAYNQSQILSAAGLTVPEPATATLSLLALAGLAARRRRK